MFVLTKNYEKREGTTFLISPAHTLLQRIPLFCVCGQMEDIINRAKFHVNIGSGISEPQGGGRK